MKDYRLSEIMSYCYSNGDCEQCELKKICSLGLDYISVCDIEQRDMIELPCKIRSTNERCFNFQIVYRSIGGFIRTNEFDDEAEADEFLQELKNGKV